MSSGTMKIIAVGIFPVKGLSDTPTFLGPHEAAANGLLEKLGIALSSRTINAKCEYKLWVM